MNETIKRKIKESRVMQYEIAAKIGVSEFTFCRWFRKPLTAEQERLIVTAISEIRAGEASA